MSQDSERQHAEPGCDAPAGQEHASGDAFVEIAPLYDELMQGVPYANWIVYLNQLLQERKAQPRRVLDLACGTGNVTQLLAREGYEVMGVDIAPGMIAQARHKAQAEGLKIDYHVQDAALLDLPGRRFDPCVSLFDSLNYILEPSRLAAALLRVAAHLTRNGLFIFDLNTEYALANHFFDQENLGSNDPLRYSWVSVYSPETRLCRVEMRFWYRGADGTEQFFEEVHRQYAYRIDEVQAMMAQAGFTRISVYKAYTLRTPPKSADRVFYVGSRE